MPRAKKVVVEEPILENEVEPVERVIQKKKPVLKRQPTIKPKKQPEPEPEPEREVSDSELYSSESEGEEPVKAPVKSRVKKEKKPLSLWMQTLQENGFMCKGGQFKPTPKKGTPEYIAVRAAFDAKKAALSSK